MVVESLGIRTKNVALFGPAGTKELGVRVNDNDEFISIQALFSEQSEPVETRVKRRNHHPKMYGLPRDLTRALLQNLSRNSDGATVIECHVMSPAGQSMMSPMMSSMVSPVMGHMGHMGSMMSPMISMMDNFEMKQDHPRRAYPPRLKIEEIEDDSEEYAPKASKTLTSTTIPTPKLASPALTSPPQPKTFNPAIQWGEVEKTLYQEPIQTVYRTFRQIFASQS